MKIILYLTVFVLFASCNAEKPAAFSKEVLNEEFLTLNEETITFKEILAKYKGKKVMFEVCASWCAECVSGIPQIKKLKAENPDVVFVFLSIDKSIPQWKKGIERFFNIEGDHYFLPASLKSGYAKSLGINDVPSYMVVNERGIISLASVMESFDPRLEAALKEK
ncbi:TlpA disulfide reductase family protein [Tenacibaculum ovolyticum]|uniref:TlpA family protein disulfide reductase n=1 Tax=Tenacibaculum ovolyticum TaxID=104270 RepID=UPI000408690F|nr:TlpA disulfide reductase family protein [Tenacibaculum ovolyticum]WBX77391.1 TlpA disulfide reductase family protein [Tenacibaculum ovolyticum]